MEKYGSRKISHAITALFSGDITLETHGLVMKMEIAEQVPITYLR